MKLGFETRPSALKCLRAVEGAKNMTHSLFVKTTAVASLFLVAALAGCVGADAKGTLAIFVKDAPTDDYDEIFVTFTRVEVKPENGTWVTVMEGEESIDLLALSAPLAKEKLGLVSLDAGDYKHFRVDVKEAKGVKDGNETLFKVPSGTLKFKYAFTVEADKETQIVLDFDLDKSINDKDAKDPIFKPTLKAVKDNKKDADGDGTPDIDDADTPGEAPELE